MTYLTVLKHYFQELCNPCQSGKLGTSKRPRKLHKTSIQMIINPATRADTLSQFYRMKKIACTEIVKNSLTSLESPQKTLHKQNQKRHHHERSGFRKNSPKYKMLETHLVKIYNPTI